MKIINNTRFMVLLCAVLLTACNSGSTNHYSNNNSNAVATPVPTPLNHSMSIKVSPNYQSNLACSNINTPCVSVTICPDNAPTSSTCTTVNNILIDSGSGGLRVFRSLLTNTNLTIESTSNGNEIADCVTYGDGSATWGPMALATLTLESLSTTQSIPIQLIDSTYPNTTTSAICQSTDGLPTTPTTLGFNGLLGTVPIVYDNVSSYYSCNQNSCTQIINPQESQVAANPIAFLPAGYENGVTFKFPALGDTGAINAEGFAIFGVGTNIDNTPPDSVNLNYYPISSSTVPTGADGQSTTIPISMLTSLDDSPNITYGFLDTGSNYLYFDDSNIPKTVTNYSYYYSPSNLVTLQPYNTTKAYDSVLEESVATSINVYNGNYLFGQTNNSAFNDNAAPYGVPYYIDYGLPFFFGKTIYMCFEGKVCNGIAGPYWAF